MDREYCRVLQALQIGVQAVGRGEASAREFHEATGVKPCTGGLARFLYGRDDLPQKAIVAVNVENLFETVKLLLANGIKEILVEKPGAGSYEQIRELDLLAKKNQAKIFVAYNRRFYASVKKAKEIIAGDGGVCSFRFEFTEWADQVVALNKEPLILEKWFLSNSTHVIDLAFYLGGIPEEMCSFTAGSLDWYKKASRFSGAGITRDGASFSFISPTGKARDDGLWRF